MISVKAHFVPNFAVVKHQRYAQCRQNSAMEYAMWYQEHLLRMEDVLGRKMEAKIEELLDRKFHEYMEQKE